MDVIGDVSLNKNVSISGELIVFGDISGSGKNLYSIPNEALDNSMIRINGNDVSLGGELNFGTSQWIDNSFGDISNIYYTDGNVGIGISGPDVSYALDISGSLKVSNNISIGTDTLDTSYALDVSGDSRFLGKLVIINDASFGNRMDVTGDVSLNKNLTVDNNVDISNNLTVKNRMDITGDVSLNKNVSISGELIVFLSLIHI